MNKGKRVFWSGVDLTGNQTVPDIEQSGVRFWSGVDLTGNQTLKSCGYLVVMFWSGVDLTGNQTCLSLASAFLCFGAVSI